MGHLKQGQGACGSGSRMAKSDLGDSGYNGVKRVLRRCTRGVEELLETFAVLDCVASLILVLTRADRLEKLAEIDFGQT